MPFIKMEEGDLLRIPAAELRESLALKIHRELGRQIHIDFPTLLTPNHYTLRSSGYIGNLSLDDKTYLQINPKIPLANLLGIIEYAYKLDSIQFLEGATQCQNLDEVFEFIAAVLARKVRNRAQRGLFQDYVKKEGQLSYLRGRLMPEHNLENNFKNQLTMTCEFYQQTTNLLDNRIILWTLYCLGKRRWKDLEVKQMVHHAFRLVAGAVELDYVKPEAFRNRVYHRLNQDYRSMHAICRLFQENSGPQLGKGKGEFTSLLVYMPALFEAFIAEWLKANLGGGYQLQSQYRVALEGAPNLAFRIDLVLKDVSGGKVLAVLDTKYKRGKSPEKTDIQQVVAYAVRMETKRAFLVYPSEITERHTIQVGDVLVETLVFDLGRDLRDSGAIFMRYLLEVL